MLKNSFLLVLLISLTLAQTTGNIKRLTEPPEGFDLTMMPKPAFGPSQTYTITLRANTYTIDTSENKYHEIRMTDFGLLSISGKPELPSKSFEVALPPEANVISIDLVNKVEMQIDSKFNVRPSLPLVPGISSEDYAKKSKEEYERNYKETYLSDNSYPEELLKLEGCSNMRKWRYASIRFTPFQYKPKSQTLTFIKSATVKITYSIPFKSKVNLQDTVFDMKAKRFFINYEEAKKWYEPKGHSEIDEKMPYYSYFILIPSDEYIGPMTNFALWKASRFAPDTVVYATTDWVNTYFTGRDLAEKVRNALIYLYNRGIRYALLIGEAWQIPMRECWPNPNDHQRRSRENPVPTDYYYADLTGDWDSDGDGYFGEYGQDAVDFAADIYVGRIDWADTSIVRKICNKTVTFEQNTGSWKKNALLLGAIWNYENENGYLRTDGALTLQMIKDSCLTPNQWTYTRLYEKAGISPSIYLCEDSISRERTIAWWTNYSYGFVNWQGHGSEYASYRKIWSWDNGNNIPESNELDMPEFFSSSDAQLLNDNYPSVIYSSSCLNGIPDTNFYCLGDYLHKNGAVAFIGGSRVTWYRTGWQGWSEGASQSLNCYFVWWMIEPPPWPVGDALYASKNEYRSNHYSDWHDQHNLFVYNLWGDPSLYWVGYTGIQEATNVLPSTYSPSPSLKISQNPSLNALSFKYFLPAKSKVSITVFDIEGREVKGFSNLKTEPGWNKITWGWKDNLGKKLPAGIYICLLKYENFILNEKVVKLEQ
jgi:hypothetical protein